MTTNEDHRSSQARAEARIAQAQAARVRADNQGRPIGKPTKYTYDHIGRLVSATPAPAEDED